MMIKQKHQPRDERIGLLGGTFNPIHNGHLKVAELVCRRLELQKILFIPSYIPPHKESFDVLPALHRLRMAQLALEPHPAFFPSVVEIESPKTSYSIHTISMLKEKYPQAELFFILGIDAFLEIETWKDYQKVLDQCSFAVIGRIGYSLQDAWMAVSPSYADRIIDLSSAVDGLATHSGPLIYLLDMKTPDISSTAIRRRIREELSIEGLVPESVAMYIQTNKLYQEVS